jgi:hypothetical protein
MQPVADQQRRRKLLAITELIYEHEVNDLIAPIRGRWAV